MKLIFLLAGLMKLKSLKNNNPCVLSAFLASLSWLNHDIQNKNKVSLSKLLSEKINELRFMISDLAQDAQNDAKGSAGDKHETALSMMHLEQEKLNQNFQKSSVKRISLIKLIPILFIPKLLLEV